MIHSDTSLIKPDTLEHRVSVTELIDRQARQYADRAFLLAPDTREALTFQQLQQQARAVARFIASQGVARGDSVAYAMQNGPCCAIVLLGIIYGGYRAVAINLVAGRDVIAYVLAHSQTTLVLTQADISSSIEDALLCDAYTTDPPVNGGGIDDKASVISVDYSAVLDWVDVFDDVSFDAILHSDDALLMYTSGTTGRPKGVTLSHSNLIAGGQNVVMGHELSERDRALCVLPLYHINGLCVTLFGPLVSGGSVVLPKRFSTSAFWQLVDEHECSWFSVVPTQIAYLLRDADTKPITQSGVQRQQLRFGRSASAPLSPDVHGAFESRFGIPLIETMGLTETAAQILTNPMPPLMRKLGSPGIAIGDEVIIADEQQQPVAPDVEGEILVRGPNVMQRYFRNELATSEALAKGGWLRTGDLGRKDKDGYVFVTGRLKELIIKGGENIAPREIDDALYQHADVVEAAAFACPCDNFGQRVEAAVVLKNASSLSEEELIVACERRVGRFKCPDRIHFLAELPKGPSGKIQRARILEFIQA